MKRKRLQGGGKTAASTEEVEYKLLDKIRALELLGKHFGIAKEPSALDQLLALLPPAATVIRQARAAALTPPVVVPSLHTADPSKA